MCFPQAGGRVMVRSGRLAKAQRGGAHCGGRKEELKAREAREDGNKRKLRRVRRLRCDSLRNVVQDCRLQWIWRGFTTSAQTNIRNTLTFPLCPKRQHVAPTHIATSKSSNKYGHSRSQETDPVSTLNCYIAPRASLLIKSPSLYLERAALHPVYIHTAHFG